MTMITRVGYCEKCFKEAKPKSGQMFIAFGDCSQSLKGIRAVRNGRRGYTPNIYEFQRLMDKTVYYSKICCMCGCGAYKSKDEKFIYLDDEKTEECYTTLDNWNALVLFKDTGLKI